LKHSSIVAGVASIAGSGITKPIFVSPAENGRQSRVAASSWPREEIKEMDANEFHRSRRFVSTPYGNIAYVERGSGPVALFVHGYPLNGYQWREIIPKLADVRRCIALDMMAAGSTTISSDQEVSYTAQASMIESFLDALGIRQVDLVGNDSGAAVSQILAANAPGRIRSLMLSNCEVHDCWPPPILEPMIAAANAGTYKVRLRRLLGDLTECRNVFSVVFEHTDRIADETFRTYFEPLVTSEESGRNMERFLTSINAQQTLAIEPKLKQLQVPTLILWGTGDVIFPVKWAHWLKETIPGAREMVELPGAKLWFPEEYAQLVSEKLRAHWTAQRAATI
jgi:pimeloyl-ACP methyl ester carboxylesterase